MADQTKILVTRSPNATGEYFLGFTRTSPPTPIWKSPTEFNAYTTTNWNQFDILLSDTDKHHLDVIFSKGESDQYKPNFMAFKYLSYKRYTDLDYEFDRIDFESDSKGSKCNLNLYTENLKSILKRLTNRDGFYFVVQTEQKIDITAGKEDDFRNMVHKLISLSTVGSSLSETRVNFFPIDYPNTLGPEIVAYALVGDLNKKNKMMVASINSSLANLAPQKSLLSYPIDAAKQGYKQVQTRRHASSIAKTAINRGKEDSAYSLSRFLGYKKGDAWFGGRTRKRQLHSRRE